MKNLVLILSVLAFTCCKSKTKETVQKTIATDTSIKNYFQNKEGYKIIHIFVALCDNKYQGIVPVPKAIGNGQNPRTNLYWGALYGVKTHFKKSKNWELVSSKKVNDTILERLVFKHKHKKYFLVADAYDGKYIKQTTIDFLEASSGNNKQIIEVENKKIGINGNANLIAYVGHDGLMDFNINKTFVNKDKEKRDVIILACYSKRYFKPHLENSNVNPLVWSTGLMAPEAYIFHDALEGYVHNESNENIRLRAAKAYAKYQKCSLKAAKRLLVSN